MENLPIDIHSNKLLDWLISRRHCPKKWHVSVDEIRPKISHAIRDMPENEQILGILSGGQYINYFHCKQILEILHETEKDTKNIFGFYSSQRIKDWKEIISLYERENVYLAEAANFLQRFVQFEVPALRRQIAKIESTARESERKEQDFVKQAAEGRRTFEREAATWGITTGGESGGDYLRRKLLALADAQPPARMQAYLPDLAQALAHFGNFSDFIGQDTADMFPFLRFLTAPQHSSRSPDQITVYEWRHGKMPERIVPPERGETASALAEGEADEIDFGDDGDIDFCINGEEAIQIVALDESCAIVEDAAESGVARGEDAFPVLEHPSTTGVLLDELDQLIGFLAFRLQDELADHVAGLYLSGIAGSQRPSELEAVGLEQIREWLDTLRKAAAEFGDQRRLQLLRIRTSPGFVDQIASQLEQKRRLESKYEQLARLANEKRQQYGQEVQKNQQLLDRIVGAAKTLQEELEADISRRYNGREVYIMGEINAVLYDS